MAGALAAAHCVASVTKQHVDLELENVGDTADHEADHRVPTCASLLTGRALAKTRPMLCVRCSFPLISDWRRIAAVGAHHKSFLSHLFSSFASYLRDGQATCRLNRLKVLTNLVLTNSVER